ncbi:MAG: hypothetical protein WAM58_06180 [Candidatus Acidiferrum sp.]
MSDQSSNDRAGLCTFTFEDGRHCSMLQAGNDVELCYFHEQQERQHLKTYVANLKVCHFLDGEVHTASDLSAAFASLFCAGVQGYVEPKNTQALTRLGHLMLKTHLLAKAEYLSAYEADWGEVVADSTAYHPFERTLEDIGNPDSLVRGPLPADTEPSTQQQPEALANPPQPQKTASTVPVQDPPARTRSRSRIQKFSCPIKTTIPSPTM